ncbi:hypothetical protein BaRGS_00004313 [Batillaria attramentaria]|uniref:Short-chain collagen C4-like n=1 Tax=Batillaria attramentaria TaxID=370345 RepID=A0ABD0LZP4_9CAEN
MKVSVVFALLVFAACTVLHVSGKKSKYRREHVRNSATDDAAVSRDTVKPSNKQEARVKRSDDSNPLEAVVAHQAAQLSALEARMDAAEKSKGFAGGSSFLQEVGGGANRLCLTLQPQFDTAATLSGYHARMYGSEYYIQGHDYTDVPCAVCRAPHPTTLMVPGTLTCPSGWVTQYTGHITATHYAYKGASEFLCLDGQPEEREHSNGHERAAFFEYALTVCGSLPCPPYQNGKVITCAVCSK